MPSPIFLQNKNASRLLGLFMVLSLTSCSDEQSSSNKDTQPENIAQRACDQGKSTGTILTPPFGKLEGYGYAFQLPSLTSISDDSEHPKRSPLVLCEDGKAIGPAHSGHDDIDKIGKGQYSHWGNYIRFSASDNSDPNTNKRMYVVVVPSGQ